MSFVKNVKLKNTKIKNFLLIYFLVESNIWYTSTSMVSDF